MRENVGIIIEADLQLAREIGQQFAALRRKKGLTQKQLAMLAGTDQATISNLEKGRRSCTLRFLNRVAKALGVEVRIRITLNEQ